MTPHVEQQLQRHIVAHAGAAWRYFRRDDPCSCRKRCATGGRMLAVIADLAIRRGRWLLAGSLVLIAVAGTLSSDVAERLDPISVDAPGSESVETREELEEATGLQTRPGVIALLRTGRTERETVGRVRRIARIMTADRAVGRVISVLNGDRPSLVSRDGSFTYVAAIFRTAADRDRQDAAERLADRLRAIPGVRLGGVDLAFEQINETIQEDLRRAELLAFPILFLLSFWFFRGLVAALLPLVLGGVAIMLTLFELRLASEVTSVSVVALNLATALGLGLALDYSLLMVSRFREELATASDVTTALRRTVLVAGRTVLFSSATVAVAMGSLLLFPEGYLYSMGLAGAAVALLAGAAALVVLPALLALLGPRVNALAPSHLQRSARAAARPATQGAWYRLATFVMRRPIAVALVGSTVLIALSVPSLDMRVTPTDAAVLPTTASARQVDEAIRSRFAVDPSRSIHVATTGASPRQTAAYERRLRRLPGVAGSSPPRQLPQGLALIELTPRAAVGSTATQELVESIRKMPSRFRRGVTGETALFMDLKSDLRRRVPIAVSVIAVAITLAIFLMTRSVVLPIKTLAMNALTVSAALGVLVLVFQHGRLEDVLNYESPGAIDVVQPVMVLAVALGLSTDYGVFLLDRIREGHAAGLDNERAVALGLERTGRIVTTAALLFCVAVGALVTSRIIGVKEVTLGIVAAVLLDATIVRALLVPALMRLLGHLNWWVPGVLRRRRGPVEDRASAAAVQAVTGDRRET